MPSGQVIPAGRRGLSLLAALLALALALAPGRPPLAAGPDGDAFYAGMVCHAPGTDRPDDEAGAAHDCCVTCHAAALAWGGAAVLAVPFLPPLGAAAPLAAQVPPPAGNGGAWNSRAPPA